MYRWLFFLLMMISLTAPTHALHAEGLDPENSLIIASAKDAFPPDAIFQKEWWPALDQRRYFTVTRLYSGGQTGIAAAGESVMSLTAKTCSTYDSSICFNTSRFYQSAVPQTVMSGYFKFDRDNAILFGLDTGYRAEKISISPALMLGLTHRHYLSDKRDMQLTIEGAGWVGQSVSHSPCIDQFNRSYYCGNLSAWSDFSYNPHPSNIYIKLWFDYVF